METTDDDKIIRQDVSPESVYVGAYFIWLLFREKCERPSTDILLEKLKAKFGRVNVLTDEVEISSFILRDHFATNDDLRGPSKLMISNCSPINKQFGDDEARWQFWDCPNGVELLDSCSWQVMIGDFMAGGLPVLERANILSDWLEITLELFPTCVAIFPKASAKLLTAEKARDNPFSGAQRFFHFGVNARLFTIQNSDEMVVDTLGMHALGLTDIQYHFRNLDPSVVVTHAYNTAFYQFENDEPIESEHTIIGIEPDSQWKCRYEHSIFQPDRNVLDVAAGEFAAGNRS